jgi:GT2 family glycosyltransferase
MSENSLDLSICIVTYQAWDYLQACLRSIYQHTQGLDFEVVVVDNGSTDGTAEMLGRDFPEVTWIQNAANLGFTKPANQAMDAAQGDYVLLLNPDTLIESDAFSLLVEFLQGHPDAGIVGPKVLNPDGSLQKPCRRSEARPWDVLTYFLGLAERFPHDRRFSGYTMSYLNEDTTHEAQGVSGSCMLIRRAVLEQVGTFDERFFAYQEDADFCIRARQAGWKVYYYPQARVIHFGGQGGSRVQPYRSIWAWHRSYYLYYRKHFARDYFFIFNGFFYAAMLVKLCYAYLKNFVSRVPFGGSRKPG